MLTKLSESIRLKRDCEGVAIPAGNPVILPAGSVVTLKQALGGDFTVRTDCGDQVRVAGKDADALGKPIAAPAAAPVDGPFSEELVWKQLRTVYDPEIPVSIVELGLVYDCEITRLEGGGHRVEIDMTLTAPGCGMADVLKQDVERKIRSLPSVQDVHVEIVFDPPWTQARMSEAARLELGLF